MATEREVLKIATWILFTFRTNPQLQAVQMENDELTAKENEVAVATLKIFLPKTLLKLGNHLAFCNAL